MSVSTVDPNVKRMVGVAQEQKESSDFGQKDRKAINEAKIEEEDFVPWDEAVYATYAEISEE